MNQRSIWQQKSPLQHREQFTKDAQLVDTSTVGDSLLCCFAGQSLLSQLFMPSTKLGGALNLQVSICPHMTFFFFLVPESQVPYLPSWRECCNSEEIAIQQKRPLIQWLIPFHAERFEDTKITEGRQDHHEDQGEKGREIQYQAKKWQRLSAATPVGRKQRKILPQGPQHNSSDIRTSNFQPSNQWGK